VDGISNLLGLQNNNEFHVNLYYQNSRGKLKMQRAKIKIWEEFRSGGIATGFSVNLNSKQYPCFAFEFAAILCYTVDVMGKYILPIEIQALEEGGYLARSAALPGFLVQADTLEPVVSLAPGVAQALIEAM